MKNSEINCEGCGLYSNNHRCLMMEYCYELIDKCPCGTCLVKMMCNYTCDRLGMFKQSCRELLKHDLLYCRNIVVQSTEGGRKQYRENLSDLKEGSHYGD